MSAAAANAINSIALMAMGLWDYYVTAAPTAIIPVAFGAILLPMVPRIAKHNKMIAHLAVMITLIALILIVSVPFRSALISGDPMKILRSSVMVISGTLAMVMFIKSFIDARKARETTQQV